MPKTNPYEKPLVYSCSGCSNAAQMANFLAIQLDRRGLAEMSCIAGVGGNVKKLVRTALSGRDIIVLDGCPLACAKACLNNHAVQPATHVVLTSYGVCKSDHEDFDMKEAHQILYELELMIEENTVSQALVKRMTQNKSNQNETNT